MCSKKNLLNVESIKQALKVIIMDSKSLLNNNDVQDHHDNNDRHQPDIAYRTDHATNGVSPDVIIAI